MFTAVGFTLFCQSVFRRLYIQTKIICSLPQSLKAVCCSQIVITVVSRRDWRLWRNHSQNSSFNGLDLVLMSVGLLCFYCSWYLTCLCLCTGVVLLMRAAWASRGGVCSREDAIIIRETLQGRRPDTMLACTLWKKRRNKDTWVST